MKTYADPVANAEVQRLRAENERLLTELDGYDLEIFERLRGKVARVEALTQQNRERNLRNDVSTGYTMRFDEYADTWLREDALTAALADPEEDE